MEQQHHTRAATHEGQSLHWRGKASNNEQCHGLWIPSWVNMANEFSMAWPLEGEMYIDHVFPGCRIRVTH